MGFSVIVIPSAALDLYCIAEISVYAPRENDVLVLSYMRQCVFCNKDFSATLEMTTARSAIKTSRRLDPSTQFSYFR